MSWDDFSDSNDYSNSDNSDWTIPSVDPTGNNINYGDAFKLDPSGLTASLGAPGAAAPLSSFEQWMNANPKLAGSIFGAAGPLASLVGSLASGGLSGTQTRNDNVAKTGSENTVTSRQQQDSKTGYDNTTVSPTIDPAAQGAMDRLSATLSGNAGKAQGAYDQGLSLLQQLATGQMGRAQAQNPGPGAPNTTPSPSATGNFPTALPTEYNAGIGNLIKQAMGSFVGDLGSQAITNARNRGFAGGGDLLNSAAAPMMGQSLAQVPALEAKAYMDHVLSAYDLQSQNAARESGANAAALNAGTNALAPGLDRYKTDVWKYGQDRTADNAQLGQMTSLLQALQGPQQDLMRANQNLLTGAPRGELRNNLSGSQANQSLSGATQTGSNSLTQGTVNTQDQKPIGQTIGTGLNQAFSGIGQGIAAGGASDRFNKLSPVQQAGLLKLLGQG